MQLQACSKLLGHRAMAAHSSLRSVGCLAGHMRVTVSSNATIDASLQDVRRSKAPPLPAGPLFMRNSISFSRSRLQKAPMQFQAHRFFSSQPGDDQDAQAAAGSTPALDAVDPTLGAGDAAADALGSTDVSAIVDTFGGAASLGYWPSELVQKGIENVHNVLGLPYWEAIALFTLLFRTVLLPVTLKSLQNAGKLTAIRPQLQALTERYTKNAAVDMNDPAARTKLQREILELYRHYKINPLSAFVLPFLQLPIFVSFFFACRDMGQNFDLTNGGAFWFTNLTAADPTYIFPVVTSLSFLLMIEIGADGIPAQQKTMFKNIMRGLGVLMVPMTANMPMSVFMYWTTNNLFSIAQTFAMKNPWIRKTLKIPDQPKPDPNAKVDNPFGNISEMIKKMQAGKDTARTEIEEGRTIPPPPRERRPLEEQALPDDFRARPKKHRK